MLGNFLSYECGEVGYFSACDVVAEVAVDPFDNREVFRAKLRGARDRRRRNHGVSRPSAPEDARLERRQIGVSWLLAVDYEASELNSVRELGWSTSHHLQHHGPSLGETHEADRSIFRELDLPGEYCLDRGIGDLGAGVSDRVAGAGEPSVSAGFRDRSP
jgi:hypothetical protein